MDMICFVLDRETLIPFNTALHSTCTGCDFDYTGIRGFFRDISREGLVFSIV